MKGRLTREHTRSETMSCKGQPVSRLYFTASGEPRGYLEIQVRVNSSAEIDPTTSTGKLAKIRVCYPLRWRWDRLFLACVWLCEDLF